MANLIRKMPCQLGTPVQYYWRADETEHVLNDCLGQRVELDFTGKIRCLNCLRDIKKSFNQGYCYPCFTRLAACDRCIVSPETCHFTQGTCRQPDWGLRQCMQTHVVYLAQTSTVKVGITRATQVPTRWIDQGASQAIPIILTRSRLLAGRIEVLLKQYVQDKTHWRKMLSPETNPVDLIAKRAQLLERLQPELDRLSQPYGQTLPFTVVDFKPIEIDYPVLTWPTKIQSIAVSGKMSIAGQLLGIKGQYWLMDSGVINIRKYGGYEADLRVL